MLLKREETVDIQTDLSIPKQLYHDVGFDTETVCFQFKQACCIRKRYLDT